MSPGGNWGKIKWFSVLMIIAQRRNTSLNSNWYLEQLFSKWSQNIVAVSSFWTNRGSQKLNNGFKRPHAFSIYIYEKNILCWIESINKDFFLFGLLIHKLIMNSILHTEDFRWSFTLVNVWWGGGIKNESWNDSNSWFLKCLQHNCSLNRWEKVELC